ncbi:Na/Pi cotransporter family protein [Ruegeria conchae]|uniref:Na/Pi cotransporter family protein n=1 Tax=Ruegeria conchae TaxID=981384 RepID=UPI0029C7ACE9|nr:Na/Pi cotransporter family protein [Ruegeria conchae]
MMDSSPIIIVLNLAAAAALLIWAVRLVRTGFERAFGSQLRLWLRRSTGNRLAATGTGTLTAILLQSSTAVAMLLAGFMAAGSVGGTAGLAIILGADLGSAIVAQIMNSRIALLTPLLLLIGVLIFLRSSRRSVRQVGRILIGLALIFLSLDLIRDASAPLANSEAASGALIYLSADPLTAFLLAAFFAWLVHSSVAAILLFATLAAQGVLPLSAAFAMVLGANLGGAFIAFVLTLQADVSVRRVVSSNLFLRGGGAGLVLFLLYRLDGVDLVPGASPVQQVLNLHLLFNLALLVVCIPFLGPIMRLAESIIADDNKNSAKTNGRTALDPSVQNQPSRAFACAHRELVEMGNRIEIMVRDSMTLFDNYDDAIAQQLKREKVDIDRMSLDLRVYLSGVKSDNPKEDTGTRAFDLSGVAVNLEAGADTIARKMVELAKRKSAENVNFSNEGWQELTDFYDRVLRNVQHGIAVLMTEDAGAARELVQQKEMIREIERKLERAHLTRLRAGVSETIETSAIHLDLLRALKMLNTAFAMIAYPLLKESGQLLESRLANE